MSRNSVRLRALAHGPCPCPSGAHCNRAAGAYDASSMRRLGSFLVASVLVAMPCCGRTSLDAIVAGAGGAVGLGGITGTGGVRAAGGTTSTGGSTASSGGLASSGGIQATGGVIRNGGAISASGGSVSAGDLDACSSDADCTTSCVWTTAPTDSSQCFAEYCCGSNWMSKRRCEANQAAWAVYCPNQSATRISCPCITMCNTPAQTMTFGCAGGKCEVVCSPPLGGTGGSTVFPLASGGSSGSGGGGGMARADAGRGGIGGTGGTSGSSVTTSPDAGCATPTAGTACSATSVVCPPNGCCSPNNFVCVNGEWVNEPPCLCP
jgi:hypothetical protein